MLEDAPSQLISSMSDSKTHKTQTKIPLSKTVTANLSAIFQQSFSNLSAIKKK